MGRSRYKILNERYPYFITSSVVNKYPIFDEKEYAQIIIDGLNFLVNEKEIKIYAYVIMKNHLHLILQGNDLGKHFAQFKSYSARRILDSLETKKVDGLLQSFREAKKAFKTDRKHQFWAEGFHPKQVFSADVMRQKIRYIHYNPVKAGFVKEDTDWKHSSSSDYSGNSPGLVKVTLFAG
ncbi:MAG: transposase [Gracilimonas sp.]